MIKTTVKKLLNLFSIKVIIENRKHEYLKLGLNNENSTVTDNGKKIFIKDLGFTIDISKHEFTLKGLRLIRDLRDRCGAIFNLSENQLTASINNCQFNINTFEELFILNEIFINGSYNISINKPFVLIDIGMNVAFTSIWFARQTDCIATYSFEPLQPTFLQATNNIALNPQIASKINTFNFGLGDKNEQITVTFNSAVKGNVGINGIPDALEHNPNQSSSEQITLKNAAEILRPLLDKYKNNGCNVIMKIDCEGSEYGILETFKNTSILQSINILMIEWHIKGPEAICRQLQDEGFQLVSLSPFDHVGMIYAFR